ncbi:BZ3500_MvSof-1268-A1-R1_Chr2-3g05325 [Microbotryum saponariae]|uniref:BZ3500_MvSof-1268-A1-R1_Chr2-3g05325 protein n=1 Tax=Microbotryum saponariae TaxID=289078 RepID=A0A2X0K6X1_9BASI|nr:BZ3500_MvSof-1268-A1-R1_Chr2-3g05325 [Microbotryum saponariae]SDA01202.1 BZ3501_MvSof-1269-A2-R1_Chr2-2g04998 [Microbotryum saponariae]
MVRFAAAIILASAGALVSAQSAALPSCVLPCFSSSVSASGSACTITDISCLCKDTNFQIATVKCFMSSCPASDLPAAEGFGTSSCSAVGVTIDQGAISAALAAGTGSASAAAASSTAAPASSAAAPASSAASAATSAAAAASSVQASATSAAAAVTSAAAAATSKAASSADKVAVTGVLGFAAGLVALLA